MKKEIRITGSEVDNQTLIIELRFDDECRNGQKSFAITGSLYEADKRCIDRNLITSGCIHETIEELQPGLYSEAINFHLVDERAPMHYIANSLYHAENEDLKGFRSCACWPDATESDMWLADKEVLESRLPSLMVDFYNMLESFDMLSEEDKVKQADWVERKNTTLVIKLDTLTPEEIAERVAEKKRKKEEERIVKLTKEADKLIERAKKESEEKLYAATCQAELMKAGFDTSNLIYYSHKDEWCLGWRERVTKKEGDRLKILAASISDKLLDKEGICLSNKITVKSL